MSRRSRSLLVFLAPSVQAGTADWTFYGGDAGGSHYSSLAQINRGNVGELVKAWEYRTGELDQHPDRRAFASFHATPLLLPPAAGQSLVFCTPFNRLIALDPATGAERWVFDPGLQLGPIGTRYNCRGIAYWRDGAAPATAACAHRLYMGTGDLRLVAVDARTGRACRDFGAAGFVDVKPLVLAEAEERAQRIGRPVNFRHGDLQFSAPPTVAGSVVVIGSANNTKFRRNDGPAARSRLRSPQRRTPWSSTPCRAIPAIRRRRWSVDAHAATGGERVEHHVLRRGGDLVFLPTPAPRRTSSAVRGRRQPLRNSVVALRLRPRGGVAFSAGAHDVWDIDLPAQPMLLDLALDGREVPSVVQLTKMAWCSPLRRPGVPVLPSRTAVPGGGVPGEHCRRRAFSRDDSATRPGELRPEDPGATPSWTGRSADG